MSIIREEPAPQPQQGEAVIVRRRQPKDSDLRQAPLHNLNDFCDFIRMLDADGYPRAFMDLHGHRLELSRVQLEQDRLVRTFAIDRQCAIPDETSGGGRCSRDCSIAATRGHPVTYSSGWSPSTGRATRSGYRAGRDDQDARQHPLRRHPGRDAGIQAREGNAEATTTHAGLTAAQPR